MQDEILTTLKNIFSSIPEWLAFLFMRPDAYKKRYSIARNSEEEIEAEVY